MLPFHSAAMKSFVHLRSHRSLITSWNFSTIIRSVMKWCVRSSRLTDTILTLISCFCHKRSKLFKELYIGAFTVPYSLRPVFRAWEMKIKHVWNVWNIKVRVMPGVCSWWCSWGKSRSSDGSEWESEWLKYIGRTPQHQQLYGPASKIMAGIFNDKDWWRRWS